MAWRSALKQFIKGKKGLFLNLRPLRFQLRLYEPIEHEKLVQQMNLHGINLVYDVGANKGQFGSHIFAAGYNGKVISFEPLSEAHALLTQTAKSRVGWSVAPRCAIGAQSGETTINISGNSQSSSILDLTADALAGSPTAKYVRSEQVTVVSLDDTDYNPDAQNIFIKVDTQGFEMEVLKGATQLLKTAKGVQLEMSFTPMYEGAPDFETLYKFMIDRGFELWGMDTAFRDPKTRRLYQLDATFFRKA
jgi:FkbM family methyltransferase